MLIYGDSMYGDLTGDPQNSLLHNEDQNKDQKGYIGHLEKDLALEKNLPLKFL